MKASYATKDFHPSFRSFLLHESIPGDAVALTAICIPAMAAIYTFARANYLIRLGQFSDYMTAMTFVLNLYGPIVLKWTVGIFIAIAAWRPFLLRFFIWPNVLTLEDYGLFTSRYGKKRSSCKYVDIRQLVISGNVLSIQHSIAEKPLLGHRSVGFTTGSEKDALKLAREIREATGRIKEIPIFKCRIMSRLVPVPESQVSGDL